MSRVLIVRVSSFGDVAMLIPAVYSVAARYPHDRFVVLTRKAFAPLFENIGFNVNSKSFDANRHSGFFGLLKLILSLQKGGYSHVADMHDVLRSKIIRKVLFFQGKKVAHINKGRAEKSEMIKTKELDVPLKHVINRYMEVFEQIGFPADISFTNFFEFRERTIYPLRTVIKEKKGNWIGIAPFSKHEEKIYPLQKMENILATLSENPDNHIFLFSSGTQEDLVTRQWAENYPQTISISGKLNLENELLLISFLDVIISMDSANMHLASLVETPAVSVWGATHPALGFYGYGQKPGNAVQIDLPCRPCSVYGDLPCMRGDYACMHQIDESAVLEKVEKILSSKQQ
ncbi:glycosyltransferase family 9 protein [Viscerimonas tarda]